jgi:predicted  nucleic acid-binding Zn-ribbon protein
MAATKEYSVEEKLKGLIHLQKIESKLDEIQILKGELPMEVKDLEDEIAGLHARRLRIEEEINGIQEFIEGRKNAIKESQELLKKYEKQSENVKNNREFEAINKEIEMQGLDIKLAEKYIKDSNEDLQEKSLQHENINKTISGKEKNLEIKKGELDKIIADNEKEEKHLSKDIEKAREAVEERLLAGYERIRKSYRNGLAVVPIVRDSCGGCFNSIPPQRQSEIKQHKKVIVCENCGRILVDADLNDSVTI